MVAGMGRVVFQEPPGGPAPSAVDHVMRRLVFGRGLLGYQLEPMKPAVTKSYS